MCVHEACDVSETWTQRQAPREPRGSSVPADSGGLFLLWVVGAVPPEAAAGTRQRSHDAGPKEGTWAHLSGGCGPFVVLV